MNSQTLLHRQVNPFFMEKDRVTSQVFRPTPKDGKMLSVSDGDQITAEQSYKRFITVPLGNSIGVLSVSVEECLSLDVPPVSDPRPEEMQPDHCFIDFREKSNSQIEKTAVKLRDNAISRRWSHGPVY